MTDELTVKQCVLIGAHGPHVWTLIGQRPDGTGPGRYRCEGEEADDVDETCGDCAEGRCHKGGGELRPCEGCGCEWHEASVRERAINSR